ncbi:hypothetical protein F9L16_23530 [Agarivorans sp. B2Z047]|uniref:hypothetical protein n=1 Tax=Agarivorans sp. B2Z047 TaxID=2652721 RepID=UPI00128AF23F|nr:hypothetical protein [Agarivorans sp. B2Z047]MPW31929.1 hypothetical protein [Agarivorans sp. B2Z047]UQN41899.1 hypothetical protein LQZ07_19285 [Agarivorans sp. B2Z047]
MNNLLKSFIQALSVWPDTDFKRGASKKSPSEIAWSNVSRRLMVNTVVVGKELRAVDKLSAKDIKELKALSAINKIIEYEEQKDKKRLGSGNRRPIY